MRRRLAVMALSMRAFAWARYFTIAACSSLDGTKHGIRLMSAHPSCWRSPLPMP